MNSLPFFLLHKPTTAPPASMTPSQVLPTPACLDHLSLSLPHCLRHTRHLCVPGVSSHLVFPHRLCFLQKVSPPLCVWRTPIHTTRPSSRVMSCGVPQFCSDCVVLLSLTSLLAQAMKESACNAGDLGSIPGLGRSPGEGKGNPLQCSCLENFMDRKVWLTAVPGDVKSQTPLSDSHTLSSRRTLCLYIV